MSNTVTIGGRTYTTVTIGSQEWLAENLDFQWDGLSVNPAGNGVNFPAGYYFNRDTSARSKSGISEGMLYNRYALETMASADVLPSGWRIPTKTDFDELFAYVESHYAGIVHAYKALTVGETFDGTYGDGTNDAGFNWISSCTLAADGNEWTDTGKFGSLGAMTDEGGPGREDVYSERTEIGFDNNFPYLSTVMCIRLIKDPSVKRLWKTHNGKGFASEYSDYAERASKDEAGNRISDTYATAISLDGKVDKVDGKGLSSNDYTDTEKQLLASTAESVSGKVDKVVPSSTDNLAALDANGQLTEVGLSVVNNSITAIGGRTIIGQENVFIPVKNVTTFEEAVEATKSGKVIIGTEPQLIVSQTGIVAICTQNGYATGQGDNSYLEFSMVNGFAQPNTSGASFVEITTLKWRKGRNPTWPGLINLGPSTLMRIPVFTRASGGQFLRIASWESGQSSETCVMEAASVRELPASSSQDEGSILSVNSSGSAVWSAAPTVDQTYNSASTNAQSGVAVNAAVAPKMDTSLLVADDYSIPLATIEIGGRAYPIVVIGNQVWMAENLDWQWSGLAFGDDRSSYSPKGYYFNSTTEYGIYYNGAAAQALNGVAGVPAGWHVPTKTEVDTLLTTVGENSSTKLRSTSGWVLNQNGTDDYGFSLKPAGTASDNGGDLNLYRDKQWGLFWTTTSSGNSIYAFEATHDGANAFTTTANVLGALPIRLVKNL